MKINCNSTRLSGTMKLVLPLALTSLLLTGCGRINMALNIMEGSGEVGTLADGSGEPEITLPEGLTVSTTKGHQPLKSNPLPPLPMENHPYLLDEFASGGVHGDSYNSGVSPLPGPLGIKPAANYTPVLPDNDLAMCTPMMLNHDQLLASVCIVVRGNSQLVLFDPEDQFKILDTVDIPERNGLTDPSGGWYTRMDEKGRPIVATPAQDVRVYQVVKEQDKPSWNLEETWELKDHLPKGVSPLDVVPDWQGNYWFMTGYGHVGYINRKTGAVDVMQLGDGSEKFGTALAVNSEAAFILSTRALYRLEVTRDSKVDVRWSFDYGQAATKNGDLTAPTLLDDGKLIAFGLNDGSKQGRAAVLRTTGKLLSKDDRTVCEHPMFKPNKSFLDNSMVGYGKSLVIQNNFGGVFFELVEYEPGLARVDVREDYSGCDTVWEDYTVSSQVPPRLSTGDGYVYQYSRKVGTPDDVHVWYLAAHDFKTGKVASELLIGSGMALDNPMLSMDLLPGNIMVGGVRNGIVTLGDNR